MLSLNSLRLISVKMLGKISQIISTHLNPYSMQSLVHKKAKEQGKVLHVPQVLEIKGVYIQSEEEQVHVLEIKGVSGQKKKSASTKEPDQDLTACRRRREGGLGRWCVQCTGLEESQQNLCIAHCTVETAQDWKKARRGRESWSQGGFCLCL